MANFNLTITDEGAAFLADVIANQGNIDFTEMRFSSTNYVGQESTVTEGTWTGTFMTATPSASIVDTTTINVAASFDNSTFTTSKTLYSIGIVATDGNNTALVAVATSSTPQNIPEFVSTASHYAYNLNLAVSSTANITVSASTAGALYVFDIIDNLTSTATNKPLSANQGKALSDAKQNKELETPVTIGGTSQTTVEGAIGGLNTAKVDKTDITSILATGATNTTGATIAKDTYFYLNGSLVKAKVDIASGASYTENTNYETVTVGGALTALNSNLSINNVTISGWTNDSWVKKQGKHVFGFLGKSVSASITNGRNYSFGLSLPSDIRPQNYTLLSGYAFVGSDYVPATFETDNSGNIVVIVGSPYNNQTVTAVYIKVDLYIA